MKAREGGRREEILSAVVRYILRHGVSDLSLRPLADATGTRARLLIYHFGSKEALIVEAMTHIRRRAQQSFLEATEGLQPLTPGGLARRFWAWATDRKNAGVARLFFEVHGLALQSPRKYASYSRESAATWRKMVAQALPRRFRPKRREAIATALVGALDGLLLDYLSTGDLERTTLALNLLADEIDRLVERRRK
jgi:AcrR family transcriptional regulator